MRQVNISVDNWVKLLGEAWMEQNPEQAMALVAKEHIEWYEDPLDSPATTWDAVYQFWKDIPHNQRDVNFKYQMLFDIGDEGLAEWRATITKLPSQDTLDISGIFHVKLNTDGQCVYFKQWEAERYR